MKKFFLIIAILFAAGHATAQTKEFQEWLKAPAGELQLQKFANTKLDKEECAIAAGIVDSLWLTTTAERLKTQWSKLTISNDSI